MLDTDQLRSFLAIVDAGSFTRAAERVHKTQSAVSMHVRGLEEQLGCALFVKQGRGAKLTSEGERLIDYARRIMRAEAEAMAALSRKGLEGSVRFGVPDDYAEAFLADILKGFNRRHPLVEIAVTCENSVELSALVHAGASTTPPTKIPFGSSTLLSPARTGSTNSPVNSSPARLVFTLMR